MSIKDIITSDMITRVTAVSVVDMVLAIALSLCVGIFIFYVYKKSFSGVLYSANFGLSLIGMCMVSAVLILAVSNNIVLSLGMVGALSIVRFRTAIKEPLDIMFLFWSIAAGIIIATGMIPLAVFASIAIGIVMLKFGSKAEKKDPYMVIIHTDNSGREKTVMSIVHEGTKRSKIKGKTIHKSGNMELTVEVQLNGDESDFIQKLSDAEGVEDVVMVSYNGDYME